MYILWRKMNCLRAVNKLLLRANAIHEQKQDVSSLHKHVLNTPSKANYRYLYCSHKYQEENADLHESSLRVPTFLQGKFPLMTFQKKVLPKHFNSGFPDGVGNPADHSTTVQRNTLGRRHLFLPPDLWSRTPMNYRCEHLHWNKYEWTWQGTTGTFGWIAFYDLGKRKTFFFVSNVRTFVFKVLWLTTWGRLGCTSLLFKWFHVLGLIHFVS